MLLEVLIENSLSTNFKTKTKIFLYLILFLDQDKMANLISAVPKPKTFGDIKVLPADFEKDDDSNFHMGEYKYVLILNFGAITWLK